MQCLPPQPWYKSYLCVWKWQKYIFFCGKRTGMSLVTQRCYFMSRKRNKEYLGPFLEYTWLWHEHDMIFWLSNLIFDIWNRDSKVHKEFAFQVAKPGIIPGNLYSPPSTIMRDTLMQIQKSALNTTQSGPKAKWWNE